MSIFVTSDLHLNHKNIMNLRRSQFKTLEEHNNYIINRYNSVVQENDLVYILGDVGFTPKNELIALCKQLNGRKILVLGNHDRLSDNEYRQAGFIDIIHHPVYYNNNIILSHLPVQECLNNSWVINVHGHVHMGTIDLPNFYNVNIEENDYLPVNMKKFEEIAQKQCPQYRWQPFGTEWYAEWEKKD